MNIRKKRQSIITITLIFTLALFVLIASFSIYVSLSMNKEGKLLNNSALNIKKAVASEDWDNAKTETVKLKNKWSGLLNKWSALSDHHEIDSMNEAVSNLESYINSKSKAEAMNSLALITLYSKHIPDKESFSFRSVF